MRVPVFMVGAAVLMAACSADPRVFSANGPGGKPVASPDIRGTVTQVSAAPANQEVKGTVLVEENPGQTGAGNKIVFTIKNATEMLRRQAGSDQRILFNELRVGQSVEAWSEGPVRESFPAQADAKTILVTGGP